MMCMMEDGARHAIRERDQRSFTVTERPSSARRHFRPSPHLPLGTASLHESTSDFLRRSTIAAYRRTAESQRSPSDQYECHYPMNSKTSSWSSNNSGMYSQIDSSSDAVMGGNSPARSDLRQNLLALNSTSSHGMQSDYIPLDSRGHVGVADDVEQGHAPSSKAGASGDVDPFFVFKDDLLIKLKRTEDSLSHFVTLVHDTVRYFFHSIIRLCI
jgi:hypothetical protein